MPTESTEATKARKGKQPGPALREARRQADELQRRADELQRLLDEERRQKATSPTSGPTTTPTTPTEPATAASDDPLDEPPPPRPPSPEPTETDSSSGESTDEDLRDGSSDEKPTTQVGDDAVRGMLTALLGQAGEVNRYLALQLLKKGATARAKRAGADEAGAEQLATAYLASVGPQVRRIAEFSKSERESLIQVLTPRAKEALEGSDKDTILWVTIIGIYAGKFVQLSELVDFGADVADSVAEPQHKTVEVDVSPAPAST